MNYCPECGWNLAEPELYCEGEGLSTYSIQWYKKGSHPYYFSGYVKQHCTFCGFTLE